MSNPVSISIPQNSWIMVAEGVTTGIISIKKFQQNDYFQTHRLTGEAGPSDFSTALQVKDHQIRISNTLPVDVYIYAKNRDGEVVVTL